MANDADIFATVNRILRSHHSGTALQRNQLTSCQIGTFGVFTNRHQRATAAHCIPELQFYGYFEKMSCVYTRV